MKLAFGGRIALVTGGTRGIGFQVAQDLAELGATVLITGTDEERAIAVAHTFAGSGHRGFGVDFTDSASTDRFVARLAQEPRIDILVNNAGINRINPVDAVRDEDWTDVQHVNLEAPLKITRAVARLMRAHGYGRIVNLASIFGVISKEKRALYSMSKFGLRGLTVATAHDLARAGVLANTVSPGFVRTDLTDRILSQADQDALAAQVPLGRFASPDEISRVILFLVSDLNTYITAQNIVADGGFINV